MNDHPGRDGTVAGWVWAARTPVLAAAALIFLINGLNLYRLVIAQSPRDPWEATEVLEGWRSLQGMPVYELVPDGHSTHVYGALVPWIQGEIFRWIGPSNISGRLITLGAALVTITLLTVTMRGDRSLWYLVLAWVMLLGVNHRSALYFAENRPDMPAMLFAALAVLLMGYGQETRCAHWVVLGSVCMVVGFFFKQTAFIVSVVPVIALILQWRRPDRSEIILALIPGAVAFGAICWLRIFNPVVYYYMIDVPRAFALDWPRTAKCVWEVLRDSPLFLLLIGEWMVKDEGSLRKDPRVLWLMSVLIVALPFSAITTSKVGGWTNSLLPVLLPLTAFCVLRLPALLRRLENTAAPRHARLMFGIFLGFLILQTTFPRVTKYLIEPKFRWEASYGKVVALTARLPGTVICPEDPTIPLYAKQYAGRNVYSENDTHLVNGQWPASIIEPVLAELRTADYVIDVTVTNGWYDAISAKDLRDLGFEPADDVPLASECYQIWRRATADPTAGRDLTVFNRPEISAPAGAVSR